jgi:hypothetical protein
MGAWGPRFTTLREDSTYVKWGFGPTLQASHWVYFLSMDIQVIDYTLWAGNLPGKEIPVRAPGDREETPEEFEDDEKVRDPVDPPPARTGK